VSAENEPRRSACEKCGLDPRVSEFETKEQADSHDKWFRAKVQEAIDDPRPGIPHDEVMARMSARIAELKAKHQKVA